MSFDLNFIGILIGAIMASSVPLILAASGELITERSGVLNLGVEGMMIIGKCLFIFMQATCQKYLRIQIHNSWKNVVKSSNFSNGLLAVSSFSLRCKGCGYISAFLVPPASFRTEVTSTSACHSAYVESA